MMNVRYTMRWALLGAGLVVGTALLPSARAEDQPADGNKPARPEGGRRQRPEGARPDGGRPQGGGDPSSMMDRYQQSIMGLNLTEDQKTKLTEAFTKTKKEMDDLKAVIGSTLTDDQKQALAAKMPSPGGRPGGAPGGAPPEAAGRPAQGRPGAGAPGQAGRPGQGGGAGGFIGMMKQGVEQLSLTDEQKPKVEAIFKEGQEKMDAAMKDAGGNRDGMREKVMPIMQDIQTKVGDVLTAEQKTKWEEQRSQARAKFGQGRPGGAKPDGEPKKE